MQIPLERSHGGRDPRSPPLALQTALRQQQGRVPLSHFQETRLVAPSRGMNLYGSSCFVPQPVRDRFPVFDVARQVDVLRYEGGGHVEKPDKRRYDLRHRSVQHAVDEVVLSADQASLPHFHHDPAGRFVFARDGNGVPVRQAVRNDLLPSRGLLQGANPVPAGRRIFESPRLGERLHPFLQGSYDLDVAAGQKEHGFLDDLPVRLP